MTRIISIVGGLQPSTPTIGTATAGDTTASVAFTPSSYIGKGTITYTATSSPGGLTATGASSPLTVTGLSNGTAYTFTVVGNTNYGVASLASAASNSITPAAQGSFESIQTVYLASGNQTSLNFDSIPSTFTHLQLRGNLKSQRGSDYQSTIRMRFNADGGSNYIYARWQGKNGTANGFISAGSTDLYIYNMCTTETGATNMAPFVLDIYNYSSTSIYKTIQANSGVVYANTDSTACKTGGAWASTSAINAISLVTDDGSQFSRYSRIGLYGIKGA
jgi:hypothetical protein